ncbi:WYL domain-containing protein [Luteolibacter arcticus]|uniref:WYL domain-containing protein n=1 Tax=Luteolibacter arcticus TaxID=1581411 RepID=A0ABT3GML8_9BACT|nr:WYL domain-containing protein [Luteolibacter arcticus]MCW1924772.1 WYL domain-containing protein [Luteolibacter arcticus]
MIARIYPAGRKAMDIPQYSTQPDAEEIRRAIREHRLVEFYYIGELLTVEPYIHGMGKRYQAPVLLAWDPSQGWKEYSCMRIRRLRVLDQHYARSREDYDPKDPRIKKVDVAAEVIGKRVTATR